MSASALNNRAPTNNAPGTRGAATRRGPVPPRVRAATPTPSSRIRGRKYSTANVDFLLSLIEEILPVGANLWDDVANRYNEHFGEGNERDKEDLRNKFKKLRLVRKPTGNLFIQLIYLSYTPQLISFQEIQHAQRM